MSENNMRRGFSSREDLIAYVRGQFPDAAQRDDHVSEIRGGRAAAQAQLWKIDPVRYAATRNQLNGGVTRLSAYLRHGVLSLVEVKRFAIGRVRQPRDAEKLINELGWRDYFQRVYKAIGEGIWQDQEAYKTGFQINHYADQLPDDVRDGTTGLKCMDAFSRELRETGYLHNHARMWMSAYLIHWRRVKWQTGAYWFLQHLLDGDPASNNLSWQWVASTFSQKPYIFNRENVERLTKGVYCSMCPLYRKCDFEGSYEQLEAQLFPNRDSETNGGR